MEKKALVSVITEKRFVDSFGDELDGPKRAFRELIISLNRGERYHFYCDGFAHSLYLILELKGRLTDRVKLIAPPLSDDQEPDIFDGPWTDIQRELMGCQAHHLGLDVAWDEEHEAFYLINEEGQRCDEVSGEPLDG